MPIKRINANARTQFGLYAAYVSSACGSLEFWAHTFSSRLTSAMTRARKRRAPSSVVVDRAVMHHHRPHA
ncbi:MAG: hypothetical protein ACREUY_01935, partial [Burkholderiales bacterium]